MDYEVIDGKISTTYTRMESKEELLAQVAKLTKQKVVIDTALLIAQNKLTLLKE